MFKTKAFISALLLSVSALALASCGGASNSSSSENEYANVDVDSEVRNTVSDRVNNSELLTGEL